MNRAYRSAVALTRPKYRGVSLAVVMLCGFLWLMRHDVNADVSFYLHAGNRLAEGAVLYRDIGDMNPPLIYLLQMPFIYAGRLMGVAPHVPLFVGLMGMLGGVLWISARLLRAMNALSGVSIQVLLLFTAFRFGIIDRKEVGQRDHLAAFAFLPFLLLVACRASGSAVSSPALAGGVALVTGIAVALKPYFVAPWAAALAYLAWRIGVVRAMRSPECWVVVLVNGLHWAMVLAIYPDFIGRVAGALQYYSAIQIPYWIIALKLSWCGMLVGIPFLRMGEKMRALAMTSVAVTAGFVAGAIAQHKGWPYHLVPPSFFGQWTLLLAVVYFLETPRLYRKAGLLRPRLVAALLCLFLVAGAAGTLPGEGRSAEIATLRPFLEQRAGGKPVLFLTTELWLAFPLVYEAGLRTCLPDPYLWILPGLYRDQMEAAGGESGYVPARYHREEERNADERALFDSMRRAILEMRPEAIVLHDEPPQTFLGRLHFNFVEYLSTDSALREALGQYREELRGARYRVLVRRR